MSISRRLSFGALLLVLAACERAPTDPAAGPAPVADPGEPSHVFSGDTMFTTDFGEYATGAQPTGWTQRWDPTTYFAVADEPSATGGKVLQWSATGQSRNRWALAFDGFGDTQDQRVYTEFRVRSLGGGTSTYDMGAAAVRVSGTASDERGYALFFVTVPGTGAEAVVLSTWSSGAYVQFGSFTTDWELDTWYSVRLEAVGTTIRARVWPRGTAEPGTWTLSATDTRYASGRPGVSHHDNGTVQWDHWQVTTVPVPPPPPPTPLQLGYHFNAGAAWTLPAGWTETSAPANSEWTVAADLAASDGRVMRNVNTATARHILRLDAAPATEADQEVLVKLRMADADARGPGVALRHTMNGSTETAYVAYFRPDVDQVEINRFLNGGYAFVASASFPNNPGAWYWMRFRAQGTTLSVRVWADGAAEPATWTRTATDAGIGTGSAGLYTYEPNTVDFDLFSYASLGATAATPAGGAAPVLAQVIATPGTATVLAGGTEQFRAYGVTATGDSVAVPVTWSATGGTIDAAGLYTAGVTVGSYQVTAVQQGGSLGDTSPVEVVEPWPPVPNTPYETTFALDPLDQELADWVESAGPDDVDWIVRADATATDGRVLRSTSTAIGRHIHSTSSLPLYTTTQEGLTKIRMADDDSYGPGLAVRHLANDGGGETAYVAFFRSTDNTVEINRFMDGSWKFVSSALFVNDPGVWYWMRFRAEGTTLKVRVWADGTPEPATWTLTAIDDDLPMGIVGLYTYEPNTVDFDAFSAVGGGSTAPTP